MDKKLKFDKSDLIDIVKSSLIAIVSSLVLILVFAIAKIGSFFTENLKSVDNEFLHQLASSGIIEFVNNFNPIDF